MKPAHPYLLALLLFTQSALAQEVILQGAGNLQYADGSDGRKVLYSGDSESPVVQKHQKKTSQHNLGGRRHAPPRSENSAIYRCHDGKNLVFVDEDNRGKYRSCHRVSDKKATPAPAPTTAMTAENPMPTSSASPCSGALIYQGNTYLFSEHEPCPIAHEVFQGRISLEAQAMQHAHQNSSVHSSSESTQP